MLAFSPKKYNLLFSEEFATAGFTVDSIVGFMLRLLSEAEINMEEVNNGDTTCGRFVSCDDEGNTVGIVIA